MQGKAQMAGDRQMQKVKQESTCFVASCSPNKYPFSLFWKKFQKLKWRSGHHYIAKLGNIKIPTCFSMERNKTLYVDYHPMTPKTLKRGAF
jgi:hypothetical protein